MLTGGTFESGDVISVTLDCDKRILHLSKNGVPLPSLSVQARGKLFPWINLYQPRSSVTILDEYTPPLRDATSTDTAEIVFDEERHKVTETRRDILSFSEGGKKVQHVSSVLRFFNVLLLFLVIMFCGITAKLTPSHLFQSTTHSNACVTIGFNSGKHT